MNTKWLVKIIGDNFWSLAKLQAFNQSSLQHVLLLGWLSVGNGWQEVVPVAEMRLLKAGEKL